MSSRIEKGGHRFQPKLAAAARRRPGPSTPASSTGPRPPPSPQLSSTSQHPQSIRPITAATAASSGGAMSPPPPPGRSARTPSASPHPSSSSTGAIRSYATATPSSSRIQTAAQLPVNFKLPSAKSPASITPGSTSRMRPTSVAPSRIVPSTSASSSERRDITEGPQPSEGKTPTSTPSARITPGSKTATHPGNYVSVAGSKGTGLPSHDDVHSSGPIPHAPSHEARAEQSQVVSTNSNYQPSNIEFPAPPGRIAAIEEHPTPPTIVDKGKGKQKEILSRSRSKSNARPGRQRERDPAEVGHSPSAFDLFSQDRRRALMDEHPDATTAEMSTLLAAAWKEASNQEKAYWEEQSAASDASQGLVKTALHTNGNEETTDVETDVPDKAASDGKKRKRNSKGASNTGRSEADGRPKRPASAYILYSQEVRRSQEQTEEQRKEGFGEFSRRIGDQWRNLPLDEKQPFLRKAEELKEAYQAAIEKWKEEHPLDQGEENGDDAEPDGNSQRPPRKSRTKVVKNTISDDEREYEALVSEHGRDLEDLRLDPKATSMADLAIVELKSGRASQRLFELNRVRSKQLEDAAAMRKAERENLKRRIEQTNENLRRQMAGERVELPKHDPRKDDPRRRGRSHGDVMTQQSQQGQSTIDPPLSVQKDRAGEEDDEEEVEALSAMDATTRGNTVSGLPGDDSDDEDEAEESGRTLRKRRRSTNDDEDGDDAGSDAGSVRSATSAGTYASLRETAHVPQVRVVDGQIVLDETSLTVNRTQEQAFEESDMIDEEIGHKFINSSTGSRREKSVRWTAEETEKFFKAVSMWGSDFEMISRMFPNRSRKQVKNKWTREERANPTRLDRAFARRVPVDLEKYAILANVDLSGPAPHVDVGTDSATVLKKKMEGEEEILPAEGEGEGETRKIEKVSATPDPGRTPRRDSSSVLVVGDTAMDGPRSTRASSVASTHAPGGGTVASSSRGHHQQQQHQQQQQQQQKSRQQMEREKRETRERARRADSLREGREKRSVSRGTSRGATGSGASGARGGMEEDGDELPQAGTRDSTMTIGAGAAAAGGGTGTGGGQVEEAGSDEEEVEVLPLDVYHLSSSTHTH